MGGLWASTHLLRPLIGIGRIVLAIDILVLLPLSIFRSLRSFTGGIIFVSSYIFGLVTWILGLVITYALWGIFAVIVGMFIFGVGVVPTAILALAVNGYWKSLFTLLMLSVVTFAARLFGVFIMAASRPA